MNLFRLILAAKSGFTLANLGEIGLLITAITGFVSAFLTHKQSKRVSEEKASTDSVTALEGLVDRYLKEVQRVDLKYDEISVELEGCRNDKLHLQEQINELKADKLKG